MTNSLALNEHEHIIKNIHPQIHELRSNEMIPIYKTCQNLKTPLHDSAMNISDRIAPTVLVCYFYSNESITIRWVYYEESLLSF